MTDSGDQRSPRVTRRGLLIGGGVVGVAGAAGMFAAVHGMGSMADYDAAVARTRAVLRQQPAMADIVRYATLAPSGHNTQPWTFRVERDRIAILPDFTRRTPVVDPDDHHLWVSLGCAAENLALACAASGRPAEPGFDSAGAGAAVIALGNDRASASPLFDAIPRRQSTRGEYDGSPVSSADLRTLADAAAIPGVDLVLVTDRAQIDRVRDLVITGNSAQIADPAFVRELRSWLRFAPRQALRTGDGLFSATTGNPILPAWAGPVFFDMAFSAHTENDKYARQLASTPGIAVFVAQSADHAHWVLAGRAAQRFALQATALGMKCAFINQPVEVARLRPDLAGLIGAPGRRPDLVMRFGHGPALPYSARRPVDRVMLV